MFPAMISYIYTKFQLPRHSFHVPLQVPNDQAKNCCIHCVFVFKSKTQTAHLYSQGFFHPVASIHLKRAKWKYHFSHSVGWQLNENRTKYDWRTELNKRILTAICSSNQTDQLVNFYQPIFVSYGLFKHPIQKCLFKCIIETELEPNDHNRWIWWILIANHTIELA